MTGYLQNAAVPQLTRPCTRPTQARVRPGPRAPQARAARFETCPQGCCAHRGQRRLPSSAAV
eukprot:4714542-Pleurochrysis_carterae.AAC.1